MPTYDYICTKCHNAWELEQRIVEDPVRKCPKCGANTAKRQISSGAGFILKGGGWYADGYGSKKSSSNESKSDDKPAKTETKAETKTETAGAPSKVETKDAGSGGSSTSGDAKSPKKSDKKAGAA